jgi:hypothetical protein
MIIYFHKSILQMQKNESNNVNDSLDDYYAFQRALAIINHKLEIGRVFAAYKDKLIIIDGKDKKEREYLIPKSKVYRYREKEVYFNIPKSTLKEFEI